MGTLTSIVGPLVYLDANALIYFVEGHPEHAQILLPLFAKFDRGELSAITSELTIAEVLVKPLRANQNAILAAYEEILAPGSKLKVIPISSEILRESARLRSLSGIKLPDAIHAATALLQSCATFLSNDVKLAAIPGLPVALLSQLK